MPAVMKLLNDESPFFSARAVWLLSQMGEAGSATVQSLLHDDHPYFRLVAFRALRRLGWNPGEISWRLARDSSPLVRREVALAQRDLSFAASKQVLLSIARGYDGADRTYLEAFGIGCAGKESEIFDLIASDTASADPLKWSAAFAGIAWRLHPPQTVPAFKARALAASLPLKDRKAALVALGFIPTRDAAEAVAEIAAQTTNDIRADAIWWLLHGKDQQWKGMGVAERLQLISPHEP
jgi:hypothetical protein